VGLHGRNVGRDVWLSGCFREGIVRMMYRLQIQYRMDILSIN
jgi:hypothetical protein